MAFRQYTAEQLLALRESPLVSKPEHLPAIEQWIEFVYLETDGKREKLRIPHSESAQTTTKGNDATTGTTAGRQQRQARPGLASAGAGGEASTMGSFSTGRPTLGTRSSTLRGQNGGEYQLDIWQESD